MTSILHLVQQAGAQGKLEASLLFWRIKHDEVMLTALSFMAGCALRTQKRCTAEDRTAITLILMTYGMIWQRKPLEVLYKLAVFTLASLLAAAT